VHSPNQLYPLLQQLRDNPSSDWVAATVVSKLRSSYRHPGAMMLINPDGHSLGLVSGGCLEADVRLNARKVISLQQPRCVVYDGSEEGNIALELGLGCNGRVEILIQQLYQPQLDLLLQLLQRMENSQASFLLHCFDSPASCDLNSLALFDSAGQCIASTTDVPLPDISQQLLTKHQILTQGERRWSLNRQDPPIKLWIIGGGADAQPMVRLAGSLAWQITLIDHRQGYARPADFPDVRILRFKADKLTSNPDADAALLMSHNLALDAAWLARLQSCQSLRYIGLLGPRDRRDQVLQLADIPDHSPIHSLLHGPMGFDIGGDTPESIALSTLAQCHQALFRPKSKAR